MEFFSPLPGLQFIDFKMKKPARVRASSFPHAAFLVLLAAAARAGIVATYPGMTLGRRGGARRHSPLDGLAVSEGGQLFKKRPAVGEKAFVPLTQIVQPIFPFGCPENAILRAPSVTQVEDIAFQAITR
jgi:hypothetical protein